MLSHLTIGVNNVEAATPFYDAIMSALGYIRRHTYPDALGYSPPGASPGTPLWVMTPFNGQPAHPGNGWHIALLAPSQAAVDAFHAAALEHGGSSEGAPGLRPHYHSQYYAAYVRDLEGNKLQAVHHGTHRDVV
ncbi:MAG: VOC family protein [Proteobacteria bacterium]|nr:VOC family protein [Pseudomonadota bacterium]